MEILQSNYPPVKTRNHTFIEIFRNLLSKATSVDIAVGYITVDSIAELQRLVELNDHIREVNLTIGMHYIEHFTRVQYNAAINLNDYLCKNGRGEVRLIKSFKYHGKIYSYTDNDGAFAGIIGSNNLGSIVDDFNRVYETSFFINDREQAEILRDFIKQLNLNASSNIADCDVHEFKEASVLDEREDGVKKVSGHELAECMSSCTETSFIIPIKGCEEAPKSHLNVFFGKGREAMNGLIIPRHWYEVEIIVPKKIATQPDYPVSNTDEAVFNVITDDSWKFSCKISGQNNKNLRSNGDLKILGKWLKGRLENAGVLAVGHPVSSDTLKRYGRDYLTLTKTKLPDTWYLDFGVR